jgi:2-isopropylmalate synthase
MSSGHEASAAAYVELTDGKRAVRWGVGIDKSISSASLKAVVSAVNHHRRTAAPPATAGRRGP